MSGREREDNGARQENNAKLFITNLSPEVPEEQIKADLEAMFVDYGQIIHLNAKKNKNGQYSFAFLEFEKVEDAKRAIQEMDQKELHGRPMKVRQDRQMQGCFHCKKSGHFAKECPYRDGAEVSKPAFEARRSHQRSREKREYRQRSPRDRERDYKRPREYRQRESRRRSRSYSVERRRHRYSRSSENSRQERDNHTRGHRKERGYDRDYERDYGRSRDYDYDRDRRRRSSNYRRDPSHSRSRSYEYERERDRDRYQRRRDTHYDDYRDRRPRRSYSRDSRDSRH